MKKDFMFLLLINTFSAVGYSLLAPLYPAIAKERGIGDKICGLIISTFAFSNFFATPFIPALISKFGRKSVFYGAIIMEAVCVLIYGFIDEIENHTMFLLVSFVARFFHGIGASSSATLVYSATASIADSESVTKALGIMELGWCFGVATGPLLASICYYIGGYELPFYVLGLAEFACLPMIYMMDIPDENDGEEPQFLKAIMDFVRVLLILKEVICVIICPMMDMVSKSFIFPTFTNYLIEQFGLRIETASLFFVVNMASYFVMLQFLNPVTKFFGMKLTMVWGLLAIFIGVMFIPPIPLFPKSLIVIIIGLLILGIPGAAINVPAICDLIQILKDRKELKLDESSANDYASAIYNCGINLGESFGPSFGGYVTEHVSFEASCVYTGFISLGYAIFFFIVSFGSIKKHFADASIGSEDEEQKLMDKLLPLPEDEKKPNSDEVQKEYIGRYRMTSRRSETSRKSSTNKA